MPVKCVGAPLCSAIVPPELQAQGLCVLHFLQSIEQTCNRWRREMAFGLSQERATQVRSSVAEIGERLIHVSIEGPQLSDDLKMRVLSGVLALINVRESMERAAERAHKAATA